jgi:Flp pilus assembly protein TadG
MNLKFKLSFFRLFRKSDGSAIIEFALIAPVFFLLFFGVTEFGLFMYHKMAIERIAVDISRAASIGKVSDASGPCSTTTTQLDYINCTVREKSAGLINGDRIKTQVQILAVGTTVPDICLDDINNPNSDVATCTIFEEVNGTAGYQGAAASSFGVNGQVMEVLIYYPWTVQIPLLNNFFGSAENKGISMISASTIIRNEL